MLKDVNKNFPSKLESSFAFSWGQIVTKIPNRKLSVDFQYFRVFVFCHRAYSKTQKPWTIFRSSFFEVLIPFTLFRALFKGFYVPRKQLSKCCSQLSRILSSLTSLQLSKRTYHWSLKLAFLLIKAKMVLR